MVNLPKIIAVFPLARALLLPGGTLPLVIFENRYLAMVNQMLEGDRVFGMIQPRSSGEVPALYDIGCLGRITSFNEIEHGHMLIALTGVSRFKRVRELDSDQPFRLLEVSYKDFPNDLESSLSDQEVDREGLLSVLRRYLKKNNLRADWDEINQASSSALVTMLSILSPYGVAEKQALLEVEDSKARCRLLIELTKMSLAQGDMGEQENSIGPTIQ